MNTNHQTPKPKRGRYAYGTVQSVAEELGQTEVVEKVTKTSPKAENINNCPIHFGKLGNCAGICYQPDSKQPVGLIELHHKLRTDKSLKENLIRTFLHELGHLIDFHERGTSDHSKKWRNVMARLGHPRTPRCHSLNLDKKIHLRCPGCRVSSGTRMSPAEIQRKVSHKRVCNFCFDHRLLTENEFLGYQAQYGRMLEDWPFDLQERLRVRRVRR